MPRHQIEFTDMPKRRPMQGALIALIAVAVVAIGLLVALFILPRLRGEQPEQAAEPAASTVPAVEDTPAPEQSGPDLSTFAGQLQTGQVESIRVIGDSITAGYLIDGFDDPSDTGVLVYSGNEGEYYETPTYVNCWTNAFRAYASQQGVTNFVNAGISGLRMQYLAEEPDAWLGDGADVIVVMLGANDAAKESIEDFRAFAEQALTEADARSKHLVVVSPPNNERTDAVNLYGLDQIDQVLGELSAAHGWEHISMYDVLEVGTDDFFPDQCHPTEQGSAKLWEAFRTRLGLA